MKKLITWSLHLLFGHLSTCIIKYKVHHFIWANTWHHTFGTIHKILKYVNINVRQCQYLRTLVSLCCRWRGSSLCRRAWWWWRCRWSGWGRCRPRSTWAGWTPWPGASRPPCSSGATRSPSSPSTPSHLHQPSTNTVYIINNKEYIYDLHNYICLSFS